MRLHKYAHLFRDRLALTLMELLITVVILGILAGFTVRGFEKTVDNARRKEARINLVAIKAGEVIYNKKYNGYFPGTGPDAEIAEINTNLNLSIMQNANFYYRCYHKDDPTNFCCKAEHTGNPSWIYVIDHTMDMPAEGTCEG